MIPGFFCSLKFNSEWHFMMKVLTFLRITIIIYV